MFVFVLGREEEDKNDNWNFWIWVFWVQKWPFCDAQLFFKKLFSESPGFIVFWGVRAFWARLSKKGDFGHPPKERIISLIAEKLFFLVFLCFCCSPFVSSFFSFFCLFVCFLFLLFVFFLLGGFKGQVRWPEGPPHLALNPPYCFFGFFCFLAFPFFAFNRKTVFPLEWALFVYF